MNTVPVLPFSSQTTVLAPNAAQDAKLREAALKLEATFLSEMLKAAGFDKYAASTDGGSGQDQFASFLRDAQAEQMAQNGGIGLAQSLFNAMLKVAYGE